MNRFLFLFVAVLSAGLAGCGKNSSSELYPSKTITLICPWAAGGGTDSLSRLMADQLQQELGESVIVVNRTGGSGATGHMAGSIAKPDGYTITMTTSELNTMHWMGITDLTWEGFAPLFQMNADAGAIIVRKDSPFKTLNELLDHIRSGGEKLTMSGTATGGAWDLARAGMLLAADLSVDSINWVPAQGSAPSLRDLLGGHIDTVACSLPEAASMIEAGELVALAVMSEERHPEFPDVPTVKELGIDWVGVGWRGLCLPKDTPKEIVDVLAAACEKIVESDEFKNFMTKMGYATQIRGSEAFAKFLEEQDEQWRVVIEAAGYAR